MANKTEYLLNLYNLIDEEFFILNNSIEYKNLIELKELNELWNEKKLKEFDDLLNKLFVKNRINFIVPEAIEEKGTYKEIVFLRLRTINTLVNDLMENITTIKDDINYQKLVMRYPYVKIDFTEIATLTKVSREYFNGFSLLLSKMEIPSDMKVQINKIKSYLEQINNSIEITKFYENVYELFEYLNSFLDTMEGREFDWDESEIDNANTIFASILFVESVIYYVLLFKENYLQIQEEKTNISLQETTDVLEQRKEIVTEIEMLETLEKYQTK